jgi:acetoin utilization deacetylase AcuC-like enzyme
MWKFSDLHSYLQTQSSVLEASAWHAPDEIPPHEWIEAVHEREYYRSFLQGTLSTAETRRIGFNEETRRPELIRRTLLECSGTVETARLALVNGIACNLAGGTHHAHRAFGSGFTILNDLAVAAMYMLNHEKVERVAIVDLDVHQGDGERRGATRAAARLHACRLPASRCHWRVQAVFLCSGTASIFEGDSAVFTLSMHCGKNFPFHKCRSSLDIDVEPGTADREYMRLLSGALPAMLSRFRPQLVLYDAGVDVWEGDQLGHLKLTVGGIYERDRYVIETCVRAGVPVACVIGGGYDRDARALARRHALVHRAAVRVWRELIASSS